MNALLLAANVNGTEIAMTAIVGSFAIVIAAIGFGTMASVAKHRQREQNEGGQTVDHHLHKPERVHAGAAHPHGSNPLIEADAEDRVNEHVVVPAPLPDDEPVVRGSRAERRIGQEDLEAGSIGERVDEHVRHRKQPAENQPPPRRAFTQTRRLVRALPAWRSKGRNEVLATLGLSYPAVVVLH